jgi:hypothetical protein
VTPDYGFLFISLNLNQAVTRNNLHFEWEGGSMLISLPAGWDVCLPQSILLSPSITLLSTVLKNKQYIN